MFVSSKQLLETARRHHYALPAFNTCNLEMSQALFQAAAATKAPLLIQTTPSAISHAGLENLFSLIKSMELASPVPVCLHLDHGKDLQLIKKCIALGYKSVMIDASKKPFKKNIALTKKAVKIARPKRCSVEAELGALGRIGKARLTDPGQAAQFVSRTKCDSLAVAIGTSHGAYKFAGKAKLDMSRLKEISEAVPVPLVLHGASSVSKQLVRKVNKYGARLQRTSGIPDAQLRKAVRLGIAKVNIDTDLRLAFTAGLREFLAKNPGNFDPRDAMAAARKEVRKVAVQKIRLLGAANKAK